MTIWKKNIILLLFPIENNSFCEIFFILDKKYENECNILFDKIKSKDINEIVLSLFSFDIKNINEKEKIKFESLKIEEKEIKCYILIKKINFNYVFLLLDENIISKINELFRMLHESNNKYNKGLLNNDEIRDNYSPCKIFSKKWMSDFINLFNYKEKDNFSIDKKVYKNDYEELIQNIPNITNELIEKGDFYILDNNFVKTLNDIIPKTFGKDEFKDYEISLKNNKGAIIINSNLYIFETKNHINQRFNYEKINGQIKYEYLYKMSNKEIRFELTNEDWNILNSNINENGKNAIKMNINKLNIEKYNFQIIFDNTKKDDSEEKLKEFIKTKEEEFRVKEGKLNTKELEKEKEFSIKEEELRKREKELNIKEENLNKEAQKLKEHIEELNKKEIEKEKEYNKKENELNQKEEKFKKNLENEKELNKKEIQLKEENLNKREKDLKEKEKELENKGKELNGKGEKILANKNKEINEKEEKLNKKEKELDKQEKELKEKEKIYYTKEKELNEKVNNKEKELKDKEIILNNRDKELNEKEKKLNKKDEELNKKDKELNEKEEKSINRDRELNEKEQKSINRDKELNNKEKEINNKEEKLNDKEKEIKNKVEKLNDKEKEIKNKEEELNKRDKELNEKEIKILDDKNMKLKEKEEILNKRDKELNEKEKKLNKKDEELNKKEEKSNNRDIELKSKENSLNNKNIELDEKQKITKNRDIELNEKEKIINNRDKELIEKEKILNDRDKEINEKEEKSNRRDIKISEKEKIINNRENEIIEKEKILNIRDKELIDKEIISNEKEKELNEKEEKLIIKEKELSQREKGLIIKNIIDSKIPTIGLDNLGATCYMNAVLQCMAHFKEVSEKILNWYKNMDDNNKKDRQLSYAFGEVLDNLYFPHENNNYKVSYSPKNFKELVGNLNPLFKGIQANDSKDLMNFIIEKMHFELNPLGEKDLEIKDNDNNFINDQTNELLTFNNFKKEFTNNYHSFLSEYLYALQKTVTVCCYCNTMIYNFQTYNFLIFPLLDVKNFIIRSNCQNPYFNYQNYVLNLIDCFNYYQKMDFFQGENQIYCNTCKSNQNAKYWNFLYSTPTILCIVLNRGKDNKDFNENITFGTELNLSNFVQDKSDCAYYYLIGVVVHIGDSSMSGHFFSYSRTHFRTPWYKYNDSIVSPCKSENDIYSCGTPYILFYHKYQ